MGPVTAEKLVIGGVSLHAWGRGFFPRPQKNSRFGGREYIKAHLKAKNRVSCECSDNKNGRKIKSTTTT